MRNLEEEQGWKKTFDKMVEVLTQEDKMKKAKGGRKNKVKYSKSIAINPWIYEGVSGPTHEEFYWHNSIDVLMT